MPMPNAPRVFPARLALLVGWAVQVLNGTAQSQSAGKGDGGVAGWGSPTAQVRANLTQPADSTDFPQAITATLNGAFDQYLAFKTRVQNDTNVQFSMPFTVFGQWGTPNGGRSVGEIVYSPTIVWTPFTNTAVGSGVFTFSFQWNQFWTRASTGSQQTRMGMLTGPNDWAANGYQYPQLTYTQIFPGDWLAVSVGQYSFALGDGNVYAGNPQTNFINYALAQNGTQTYANAGTGTYAVITPSSTIRFAAGLQSATDVTGRALTTNGFSDGEIAYALFAQWQPTWLEGGAYSILYYDQPAVPRQPASSRGVSFSAMHNLNTTYGLFLRANNASGSTSPIETSIVFGGIMNNPFGRNRLDQAGLGLAWNKTNHSTVGGQARNAEWDAELYYNYTVFKAMQLTPDVQIYANPVFTRETGIAAVFSLRVTFNNF